MRVDHWRRVPEAIAFALEKFRLPIHSEILERRRLALAQIGGDHSFGLADQESMGETGEIVVADGPGHVVPHMLLVPNRRSIGRMAAQRRHDTAPVAVHRRDYFLAHRMV